jgi:hypothetical protein
MRDQRRIVMPFQRLDSDSSVLNPAPMKTPTIPFEHEPGRNRVSCPRCGSILESAARSMLRGDQVLHTWHCDCGTQFLTGAAFSITQSTRTE